MAYVYICTLLAVSLVPGILAADEYSRDDIKYNNILLRNLTGHSIDLNRLLTTFSAICPFHGDCEFISSSIFKSKNLEYNNLLMTCMRSCMPNCIKTHNCCPGCVFGYLQYVCIDVGIYPERNFKSYYMISHCPSSYGGDPSIVSKCASTNYGKAPVTSYSTNITYANKHCAQCNGENTFTPWDVKVTCTSKPPNLFRSSTHLNAIMGQHHCNVSFELKVDKKTQYRPVQCSSTTLHTSKIIFKSCNMTGLWSKYDETINWACENLDSHFYMFKNVFCYICNPSVASISANITIDKCNVTGKWKLYDSTLDMLCQHQPSTTRSSPFKNLYCRLCNGYEFFNGNHLRSTKMKLFHLEEDVTNTGFSFLSLKSEKLSLAQVTETLHFFEQTYGQDHMVWNASRIENHSFDGNEMKNLISSYVSVCGDLHMCARQSQYTRRVPQATNPVCSKCLCDHACIEQFNCCPDLVLQLEPYTCVAYTDFMSVPSLKPAHLKNTTQVRSEQNHDSYLVINKCSDRSSSYLLLCEDEAYIRSVFLSNIPVQYGRITYLNIYCFLCNNNSERNKHQLHLNVEMYCSTLLESYLIDDLSSLLAFTKKHCKTIFVPAYVYHCQRVSHGHPSLIDLSPNVATFTRNETALNPDNQTMYTHCNQTGFWGILIDVIVKVCEGEKGSIPALPVYKYEFKIYKNFACFICNPEIPNTDIDGASPISSCRNTSQAKDSGFTAMQCKARDFDPNWLPFKNFFCADCNLPPMKSVELNAGFKPGAVNPTSFLPGQIPTFGRPSTNPTTENAGGGPSLIQPTFRFLFSIHQSDWLTLESQKDLPAKRQNCSNWTYDQNLGTCRPLYCDEGRVLVNETCQLLSETGQNIGYVITTLLTQANVSNDTTIENINQTLWLPGFCDDIPAAITKTFGNTTVFMIVECNVYTEEECDEDHMILVGNMSQIVVSFIVEIISTDQLSDIEDELVAALNEHYVVQTSYCDELQYESSYLTKSEYETLTSKDTGGCLIRHSDFTNSSEEKRNLTFEPYVVSQLLVCPQIQLTPDEFEFENESGCITFEYNGLNRTVKDFRWHKSSVRLCNDHTYRVYAMEISSNHVSRSGEKLLRLYTLFNRICISLSLIGLVLTFFTYCIFPHLRTLPGKNIMTFVFNLFVAQSLLEFGFPLTANKLMCIISGVSIHYFWLSTFCAMNVCSFHMFKIFCISLYENQHPSGIRATFVKYLIYIQGAPLAVIAVTIIVHLFSSRGHFSGYGKGICFLSDMYSLIFTFVAPASLIFITNITFFIVVFHKIRSTPHVLGSPDKRDFLVCVRLCAIVGVTWPLQVFDGFFKLSIFSFFAIALNGLQGVYIFISYVCNSRVFRLYASLCSRCRQYTGKSFDVASMESRNDLPPTHTSTMSTSLDENDTGFDEFR